MYQAPFSQSMGHIFKVPHPDDLNFNRVISDISVVLRETTLTISDFIETDSPVETEIVVVIYLSTTEITEKA